jgi:hypothetical protein
MGRGWVSVTGLVDPPYDGRSRGRTYKHVGITLTADGQVQFIIEADAQYRLGVGGKTTSPSNQDILQGIGAKPSTSSTGKSARSRVTPNVATGAGSSNRDILNAIKKAPGAPTQRYTPTTTSAPPSKGKWPVIPGWIWVAGIIFVLYVILRIGGK